MGSANAGRAMQNDAQENGHGILNASAIDPSQETASVTNDEVVPDGRENASETGHGHGDEAAI